MTATVLLLPACRKAAVDTTLTPSVQPSILMGEPAVVLRSGDDQAWYKDLQVGLAEKAKDEKEKNAKIDEQRPAVDQAVKALLEEIDEAVRARRSATDKWSIMSLTCGRGRKLADLTFTAELGLTKLYARRPAMSFSAMPLELCVAKLARESGIQESQPRGYNPLVTWNRTEVSAYEALQAILTAHGFSYKFVETTQKVTLLLQDSPTRRDFIETATSAIVAKGKIMNTARACITVAPREKAPPDDPEKKGIPPPR
jgi:hypothetical protein